MTSLFTNRLSTLMRKRLRMEPSLHELEPDLTDRELIFRAPWLTAKTLGAIKLIAPQFHLRSTESSRRFWELNQNSCCWGEYLALEPYLTLLGTPSSVLELGPGLGRSTVFFKKKMGWEKVPFHLYEGAGDSTRYTRAGPRFADSFCGNLDVLEELLCFNEVEELEIFDAAVAGADLGGLPGPYDFIYSFFAIGFHWSIEHFLDELMALMGDRSLGAFTLHDHFDNLAALAGVPHRIEGFRKSWPRGRSSRILVLAKNEAALQRRNARPQNGGEIASA